jgi:hypothetical protein
MHDRPTVHELLDVIQTFLDTEVVPATSGRTQFLARVSANALRMVDRELGSEEEDIASAWAALDELCGKQEFPDGAAARVAAVDERMASLCERIRAGEFDEGSDAYRRLLALARDRVRAKLRVSNPRLLASDDERGITTG